MEIFEKNEGGYRDWIESHQDGYVLNTDNGGRGSTDVKLHRATCRWIIPTDDGRQRTVNYIKVCSTDESEVTDWACRNRDKELKKCEKCW